MELVMTRYHNFGHRADEGTAIIVRGSVAEVVGRRVTFSIAPWVGRRRSLVLTPGSATI